MYESQPQPQSQEEANNNDNNPNELVLQIDQLDDYQQIQEGSNVDFFVGIVIGYYFALLALIAVCVCPCSNK